MYRFEIEVAAHERIAAFDGIVGQSAVLSITLPGGNRWFHGIVSRIELTSETPEWTYFRIELVPSAWLLCHRYGSRTFQNKCVREIISEVLVHAGITPDRFRFALERTYDKREFCVQYRETDYNFIARLMEDEGIWYYFDQTQNGHVLVMADSSAAYKSIDDHPMLPYVAPTGMNARDEHISRFRLGQSVRPGSVSLTDFNFENPGLDLKARADSGRDTSLEISDYPGRYSLQSQGHVQAQIRAEEFESGRILGIGQSNSSRLSPGRTFKLDEHPATLLNSTYLVTSVTHYGRHEALSSPSSNGGHHGGRMRSLLSSRGRDEHSMLRDQADEHSDGAERGMKADLTMGRATRAWLYHGGQVARDGAAAFGADPINMLAAANLMDDSSAAYRSGMEAPSYECRFECIPASVRFRPPQVTAWPMMRGTQTARVVGPKGEEIHTDKFGRVKVQFNWDRAGRFNEDSSCWIRVSHGMAGGGYGMMFLPRVGQEVVVDFLEGNPDKPIIVGSLYNADHMPPYALPAEKTKSVIKTNSTTGGGGTNEICFEDRKDAEQLLIHAERDLHVRVKNDRVETVEHNHHLTVQACKHELVKESKTSEVRLDNSEKVGGKKSLTVSGDMVIETKGNYCTNSKGSYYINARSELVLESASAITLKVGGNFIKIDASGIVELGKMIKLNSGGSAGTGTAVAVIDTVAPLEANKAKPGRDRTYQIDSKLEGGVTPPDAAGLFGSPSEYARRKTSWIEIELVDEVGQPVPGEAYEIVSPDGETIARGTLNQFGLAHVAVKEPGTCQITFPNLDAMAWERI